MAGKSPPSSTPKKPAAAISGVGLRACAGRQHKTSANHAGNSLASSHRTIALEWALIVNTRRVHVVLSAELVRDIDTLVGTRHRSKFLTQAAEKELMRLRQIAALKGAEGAWKDEDHPELKQGSAKWVRKLRRESERRVKKSPGR